MQIRKFYVSLQMFENFFFLKFQAELVELKWDDCVTYAFHYIWTMYWR